MSIVEFVDVSVAFTNGGTKTWGLRDASVSFGDGLTVVMGVSGSGKSTLLSVAGLLRRPTSGTVKFEGQDAASLSIRALDELRADAISFVFQDHGLVPHLTLLENVMLPLLAKQSKDSTEWAFELLDTVGLGDHAEKLPSQVSIGQAQRAALCRGVIREPRLILADEVTASLDADSAKIIADLLRQAVDAGVPVILATHDPRLVNLADDLVRLEDGEVIK